MSNPTNTQIRNVILPFAAAVVPVAGVSARRTRLIFWPPATGSYRVSTDPAVGTSPAPTIVLTQYSAPLELSEQCHGDIVRREWYGIIGQGELAAMNIAVLETTGG